MFCHQVNHRHQLGITVMGVPVLHAAPSSHKRVADSVLHSLA